MKEIFKKNKINTIAMILFLIVGAIFLLNGEGQKSFSMLIIACINFIMIGVNELYYVHKRDIEYLNKSIDSILEIQDKEAEAIVKIIDLMKDNKTNKK